MRIRIKPEIAVCTTYKEDAKEDEVRALLAREREWHQQECEKSERYRTALEKIAETECHADEICACKRRMAREALDGRGSPTVEATGPQWRW